MKTAFKRAAAAGVCLAVVGTGVFVYTQAKFGMYGVVPNETSDQTIGGDAGDSMMYGDTMIYPTDGIDITTGETFVTSTAPERTTDNNNQFVIKAFAADATQEEIRKFSEIDDAEAAAHDLQKRGELYYGKIWYAEDMEFHFSDDEKHENLGLFPTRETRVEKGYPSEDENAAAGAYIAEPAPYYYVTGLQLAVKGDGIDHFSIESEKDAKISCFVISGDDGPGDRIDPANVPYDDHLKIYWNGIPKLIVDGEDIGDARDTASPTMEEVIELREKRRAFFEDINAEKYNEYFGDTLTFTVYYTDGSVSTSHIFITFDDEGSYIIDYD